MFWEAVTIANFSQRFLRKIGGGCGRGRSPRGRADFLEFLFWEAVTIANFSQSFLRKIGGRRRVAWRGWGRGGASLKKLFSEGVTIANFLQSWLRKISGRVYFAPLRPQLRPWRRLRLEFRLRPRPRSRLLLFQLRSRFRFPPRGRPRFHRLALSLHLAGGGVAPGRGFSIRGNRF